MLRKLARIALAAAGVTVATGAHAASVGTAHLNLAATGELIAIAEDGQSYSKLESSGLTFSGNLIVSMNTGKVHGYAVFHGVCGPGQCGNPAFKRLHSTDTGAKMDVNDNLSFPVSASQFPLGLTPNTQGSQILGACNDRMSSLSQNDVTFTHYVRVTLGMSLSQLTTDGFDASAFDDYTEDFGVPVTVRCKAPPRQQPDMAYDHGPLRVRSIELDLNTYSHSNHSPSPALNCRILHVAVRIETSGKGLVHFDLSKIIGDGGLDVTSIALEAKHHNGRFFADYHKTWEFSKTTEVQFRAATKGAAIFNAHPMFTPWKSKRVECENAGGGGGYTQEIPPRDLPDFPKLTGDFSFIDSGGPRCPRGKALITFKNPNNSNVHYSLDCTNGSFSGVLQPVPHPQGGYMAGTLVDLGVKKTTQMNCALKTVAPTKKLHVEKDHFFQCINPTDVGGASDLTPEVPPRDPPVLPKLTGDFSFIDTGGTHCPRGKALISFKNPNNSNVHYSLDCTNGSFSGVLQPVPHPQGGYVAGTLVDLGVKKTTQMNCALKTVAPTKALHVLKGHFFQCVKPTDVGSASDFVPESRPDPKTPSGPRIVIDPVRTPDPPKSDANVVTGTRLICVGGVVRTGACRCAGTLKPVPTGNIAWRCTRVVVDPLPGGKGSSAANATLNLGKKTNLKIEPLKQPAPVKQLKTAPAEPKLKLKLKAAKSTAR